MNCDMSNDWMMKYFDEEMNDIEEAQFKQHLKTCSICSQQFKSMSEIIGELEKTGTVEPPEDFEACVMQKVENIEKVRRESNSRMLIWLYNSAALMSIILFLNFAADVNGISLMNVFDMIGQYFASFSGLVSAVYGVAADIAGLLIGVVEAIANAAFSIVKSYYYVFVILIGLLAAVQKLFTMTLASVRRDS